MHCQDLTAFETDWCAEVLIIAQASSRGARFVAPYHAISTITNGPSINVAKWLMGQNGDASAYLWMTLQKLSNQFRFDGILSIGGAILLLLIPMEMHRQTHTDDRLSLRSIRCGSLPSSWCCCRLGGAGSWSMVVCVRGGLEFGSDFCVKHRSIHSLSIFSS